MIAASTTTTRREKWHPVGAPVDRDDPAYRRFCFIAQEGERIGWPEDEVIFAGDDRPKVVSFTLRELRDHVARLTAQIEEEEVAIAAAELEELANALWESATAADDESIGDDVPE